MSCTPFKVSTPIIVEVGLQLSCGAARDSHGKTKRTEEGGMVKIIILTKFSFQCHLFYVNMSIGHSVLQTPFMWMSDK